MKKLLIAASALVLAVTGASAQTTVKILSTNDLDQYKGFADLARVIEAEKAAGENVFFFHAGDAISPAVLSGLDKGAHIVDLLNLVKPDVFAVGNHEFDFGPDVLIERIADMDFPVLSANIMDADGNNLPGVIENTIIDLGEFQLGVFGLTSPETATKSSAGRYSFAGAVDTAKAQAAELKEAGADLIVAVAHTHFLDDLALVSSGAIDVLVSGDDHNQITYFNGDVAYMESGEQAEVVTALTIEMKLDDRERFRWSPSFEILNPADYAPSATMGAAVAELDAKLDSELSTVIGTTTVEMNTTRPFIRQKETTFGNMLADAMREAMNADVALTNGGGIRAKKVYAPGTEITAGDIFAELPFGNKTVVLEMTGADIVASLENGVSRHADVNGRWPHISGMSMMVDLTAEAGSRVSDVMIGGEAVVTDKMYTLATNDFLARGGDGYSAFGSAKVLVSGDMSVLMASQLVDYIAAKGDVAPAIDGRVSIK